MVQKLPKGRYEQELLRLQAELAAMTGWIQRRRVPGWWCCSRAGTPPARAG